MAAAERVRLPPGGVAVIRRAHDERMRLERRVLADWQRRLRIASRHARDVVLGARPDAPWTLEAHARVMRELRATGRVVGVDLSTAARQAALQAAERGAARYPQALAGLASGALGRRVPAPPVDMLRAGADVQAEAAARTEDVGGRTGEDVGAALVGVSWLATRDAEPRTAAYVAGAVGAMLLRRGGSGGDRVLVTEITAGYGVGGRAAASQMRERMPRLRKVFDATLDLRVCQFCANLHHTVIDDAELWAGVYDEPPVHPRCRCASMPWLDDWSDVLRAETDGPGQHTGVQENVHVILPTWADSPVAAQASPEHQVAIDRATRVSSVNKALLPRVERARAYPLPTPPPAAPRPPRDGVPVPVRRPRLARRLTSRAPSK